MLHVSNTWFLGLHAHESVLQTASRSAWPSVRGSRVRPTQTTERGICVAIGGIHAMRTMRRECID